MNIKLKITWTNLIGAIVVLYALHLQYEPGLITGVALMFVKQVDQLQGLILAWKGKK